MTDTVLRLPERPARTLPPSARRPWVVTERVNSAADRRGVDHDVRRYRTERAAARRAARLARLNHVLVQVLHRPPGGPQRVARSWPGLLDAPDRRAHP